jgi:hypothetical protein
LHQDRQAASRTDVGSQAVEPLGELDRIDRLDDLERRQGALRLVRLERSDEVPGRARDVGRLLLRFLDAVLAEGRQARNDGRPKARRRDGLGDRNEADRCRVTTDASTRIRNPGEDVIASVGDLRDVARIRDRYFRRRKEGISRSSAS